MKKSNRKVLVIDSMTIWNMRKTQYNGYAIGYGIHGSRKYDRNKVKRRPLEW